MKLVRASRCSRRGLAAAYALLFWLALCFALGAAAEAQSAAATTVAGRVVNATPDAAGGNGAGGAVAGAAVTLHMQTLEIKTASALSPTLRGGFGLRAWR